MKHSIRLAIATYGALLVLSWHSGKISAADTPAIPDSVETARQVDRLLAKELFGGQASSQGEALPLADDETFARRAYLDLLGEQPSPEQVTAFVLDPSPDKRRALVDRLLADKHYGQNWARYWRDVVMYRRSEDRAAGFAPSLVVYLTEKLNENAPWDQVAHDFIAAEGDVREKGEAIFIFSHLANPEEVTAEVSRIFLGIQIQCAQCHDHKTDRWKREQFHQLAAFFPRLTVRRDNAADQRGFRVAGSDKAGGRRGPGAPDNVDLEHYMPDLNDPQAKGTLMQPVLFATGQKLDFGVSDRERRETLAKWLSAPTNPYFAQAFVNRMWAELVGRGFCEPVDDMGPDHKPIAPETLGYLAAQFTASGYDVKWLLRTVMASDAYQRQVRSRVSLAGEPFIASCPQRLRADQLFNAIVSVLGIDEQGRSPTDGAASRAAAGGPTAAMAADDGKKAETAQDGEAKKENPKKKPNDAQRRRLALQGPRAQANQMFGYDPSEDRDEVAGSIPQALWMMNSELTNRSLSNGPTLRVLLERQRDDEALTVDLYLRCLAREPKPAELKTCLDYIRTAPSRQEAFEDILWSLINSTEFLYRK